MSDAFLMKGKVFSEHAHKLVYPVYTEIKYDEVRLHVRRVGGDEDGAGKGHIEFLSYAGKPLHNLNHWAHQFWDFMTEQNVRNLDMGVLVNGNFNDSYRWCRSSTGIPKEKLDKATGKVAPALDVSMVQFYLFDCPDLSQEFSVRRIDLDSWASVMDRHIGIPTKRPEGRWCHSEAELLSYFIEARERGLEGLMVKTAGHVYEIGKRTASWLKMKPEETADGRIVTVLQAVSIHGEPLGRAGSVYVQLEDGSVACPAGIPHELGALMWAHPEDYVGQWVEFKFMERDRAGGYRHPSLVRLREPK